MALPCARGGRYVVTVFRPWNDLHDGRVKQIVGGTLGTDDGGRDDLRTNFVASHGAAWFADKFRGDGLVGGHVIMLGPGNDEAAAEALAAYPGGLQVGGGVTAANAAGWLDAGASHVIATSALFVDGRLAEDRLDALAAAVGRDRLVVDLSCRRRGDDYVVMADRWQRFTDLTLSAATLDRLSRWCSEFLIHAVDVEGLCQGSDTGLIERLSRWAPIATTYAGGVRSLDELTVIERISGGRLDVTIGSALDLFGGRGVRYEDAVAFNRRVDR
jgi:phosphoribosylformimino-5-aminoimidazole carboxamide ribotide isomerase